MPNGVIYCATGTSYVEEALKSVASLKVLHPALQVILFTDETNSERARKTGLFTDCRTLRDATFSFRDKIQSCIESPFEKTVLLDTDTFILEPIDELFVMLDRFEIAATHAEGAGIIHQEEPSFLPESVPQLSTGVIAFKKCENTSNFLAQWLRIYDKNKAVYSGDQSSFREALYLSKISVFVLRQEYNLPIGLPAALTRKVKIIHDHNFVHFRPQKQKAIIQSINQFTSKRFTPRPILWTACSDGERPGHKSRLWIPNIGAVTQEELQSSEFGALLTTFKITAKTMALILRIRLGRLRQHIRSLIKR